MASTFPIYDFLSDYEVAMLRADVDAMLGDASLNAVSVSYLSFNITGGGTSTYEPTTGAVTSGFTTTAITAIIGPVTEKDSALLVKELSIDDVKALVNRADLPADPTTNDMVTISGVTYAVRIVTFCPVSNYALVYLSLHGGK